ncbi:MAG: helix-turn-helix domain-containing protein [Chloroflexota bacterium]|nr:helix-turn-helix domain-containing protein [Chloroflexota bacterium]
MAVEQERWLTVEEAAQRLSVHDQTVRRWLRSGQLIGTSINRRAGWRIRESEIDRFLTHGPAEGATKKLAA